MKHLLLLVILIFGFHSRVLAQWEEKNIATDFTLTDVRFFDDNNGFVVGGSKIFKTQNGGNTWELSFSTTDLVFFEDIFILEENVAIATGKNVDANKSAMFKTIDNGGTWFPIDIAGPAILESVFFVNTQTGFCSGQYGTILKTTDSGDTWQIQASGTGESLKSIFFIDEMNGIAVGGYPFSSVILKTTDGGSDWNSIDSPSSSYLQSVFLVNQQTGYIVGWNGEIMKTVNGGDTWVMQTSVNMSGNLEVVFTDENTGYIVGGDSNDASIQKTLNGGGLWAEIGPNVNAGLVSIHFPSFSTGYAVGVGGTVLKTVSGGVSGDKDFHFSPKIKVYPNPVCDYFMIESTGFDPIKSIKIYDTNGEIICQSISVGLPKTKIDFALFPSGYYYLVIDMDGRKVVHKIAKI